MQLHAVLTVMLLAPVATAVIGQPQPSTTAAMSTAATPVRQASATAPATAASGGAAYQSAFEGYRRFDDQPVGSWRSANDLVGRIGGWRTYAREGQGQGHDMGAMKTMPGMSMPGMEAKSADAPTEKGSAAGHDMGSMKTMPGMSTPGMESKPATSTRREGAGGRGIASMKGMPGMTRPDKDAKPSDVSSGKDGAAGHDMGSMKNMPGKAMAGMDSKAGNAAAKGEGAAGHDMAAMKEMPGKTISGMSKPAAGGSMSKEGHGAMAMGQAADDSVGKGRTAGAAGTGVVQGIDKANGKVKLTHDPIAALGWPRMTMFFRLKDSALAEKVKEGDAVDFSLEKSASGYVISNLDKSPAQRETKKMK